MNAFSSLEFNRRPRVAVVGAGISGLGAAYALREHCELTVFEERTVFGGHANTVQVQLDGLRAPVDTGFLVYNERTYPRLIQLFEELGVTTVASDMSFSVSQLDANNRIKNEWCGSSLDTVFARRRNLLSPRFLSMLRDILRFNREATALSKQVDSATGHETIAEFLERRQYGKAFSEDYLLPMAAAIWSCPQSTMEKFPVQSFVRFFNNHGLLQVFNRPQWYTVEQGSQRYVSALRERLELNGAVCLTNTPVSRIQRENDQVHLYSKNQMASFDAVILATHSPQALKLLDQPSALESKLVGAIDYQRNLAYLHTDKKLMPRTQKAWAAWNYLQHSATSPGNVAHQTSVSVTYWLNRLQPLPFHTPVFLSLNPVSVPASDKVLQTIAYEHPVFDQAATAAQAQLASIQGQQNTWFAGAWCGYGFHEDGLKAGQQAAELLLQKIAAGTLKRKADFATQLAHAA